MSQGYNVIVEADDDRDDAKAAEVAQILCEAYPSHPWHVRIGSGAIIIKHMKMSNKWGFVRDYSRVTFDAKVLKQSIVMAAGEFLERAGLARGAATESQKVQVVEGIPQKDLVLH